MNILRRLDSMDWTIFATSLLLLLAIGWGWNRLQNKKIEKQEEYQTSESKRVEAEIHAIARQIFPDGYYYEK